MINRRGMLAYGAFLPLAIVFGTSAQAASDDVFNTGGIAISGYDPVAYFTQGKPVDGSDAHRLKWMGVVWQFSSAQNMAAFEANPKAYAPQYGGYCAYAMAQGAVATTVPEAWTIHNGKLYLNFSTGVRGIWKKDIPGHIAAANMNWPDALSK